MQRELRAVANATVPVNKKRSIELHLKNKKKKKQPMKIGCNCVISCFQKYMSPLVV